MLQRGSINKCEKRLREKQSCSRITEAAAFQPSGTSESPGQNHKPDAAQDPARNSNSGLHALLSPGTYILKYTPGDPALPQAGHKSRSFGNNSFVIPSGTPEPGVHDLGVLLPPGSGEDERRRGCDLPTRGASIRSCLLGGRVATPAWPGGKDPRPAPPRRCPADPATRFKLSAPPLEAGVTENLYAASLPVIRVRLPPEFLRLSRRSPRKSPPDSVRSH